MKLLQAVWCVCWFREKGGRWVLGAGQDAFGGGIRMFLAQSRGVDLLWRVLARNGRSLLLSTGRCLGHGSYSGGSSPCPRWAFEEGRGGAPSIFPRLPGSLRPRRYARFVTARPRVVAPSGFGRAISRGWARPKAGPTSPLLGLAGGCQPCPGARFTCLDP